MSVRRALLVGCLAAAAWASAAAAATPLDTSTTLTVTPLLANVGEPVTFGATVTGVSDNPRGVVRFASGGVTFATAPLVPLAGSATASTASYVTSSFAPGTYAITATFAADDPFTFSSSISAPATLTVSSVALHNTTLALTARPAQIAAGGSAVFTATVTPTDGSAAVPSGDVTFDDNGVLMGTAPLDATGAATLPYTGFVAGTHTITASYAGDSLNRSASSSIQLHVDAATVPVHTTIAAYATPNPIVAGQSATLTAHVVQTGTPTSPPAGEVVTFTTADGVFLGQATLDAAGNASFTKTGWRTGEYRIVASYVGDEANAPAEATFALSVLPARPGPTPTLTVTAPSVATTYGGAIPALAPSYSGFVAGDTAASLVAPAVCSTAATATSPVGTYPATCSGAVDPYYAITYVGGTVTVAPAPLTVTADSVSAVAGGPLPALTATISGFVNGETLATSGVTGSASCTTTATAATAPGTYPITCTRGTLAAANYRFATFVAGTLTITPPPAACASHGRGDDRDGDGDDDDARRCGSLLGSPKPGATARVVPGTELSITYTGERRIGTGALGPVAALSAGRLLPVVVTPRGNDDPHGAKRFRYVLTVALPGTLAPGTYSVVLSVSDVAGTADTFTWRLTVIPKTRT